MDEMASYTNDNFYREEALIKNLVTQLIDELNGDETKEDLTKFIVDASMLVSSQVGLFTREFIEKEICNNLPDWAQNRLQR